MVSVWLGTMSPESNLENILPLPKSPGGKIPMLGPEGGTKVGGVGIFGGKFTVGGNDCGGWLVGVCGNTSFLTVGPWYKTS